MNDNVTEEIKVKRLNDIIALQQKISYEINQAQIGTDEVILVEGTSKKSEDFLCGRTDSNKTVIIPKREEISVGDYVKVKINRATSATLFAEYVETISYAKSNVSETA
jgi:tRNA-2-methylthio-N6-dimethylallyladenosine synthase